MSNWLARCSHLPALTPAHASRAVEKRPLVAPETLLDSAAGSGTHKPRPTHLPRPASRREAAVLIEPCAENGGPIP
jgi:hypothetical protein